jgi:hypothetical protein
VRAVHCSPDTEGCKPRSDGPEDSTTRRSEPPPLDDKARRVAALRDALAGSAPAFHAAVARLTGEALRP